MIVKAALLVFRENELGKQLLFARPHGKQYFVFPGGKQEPGETVEAALRRELQEELGSDIERVTKLGVVEGATPDGRALQMHLFTGVIVSEPRPLAEIAEIEWLSRVEAELRAEEMTPMTMKHVMPYLVQIEVW